MASLYMVAFVSPFVLAALSALTGTTAAAPFVAYAIVLALLAPVS